MNKDVVDLNINKQPNIDRDEPANANHKIGQKKKEADSIFKSCIKQKYWNKDLNELKFFVSNEDGKPLIEKENTKKGSTNNEKNLDEALKNIDELKEKQECTEKYLKTIESFKTGTKEATQNLKNFEESWIIGKLKAGLKESTRAQKILTFAKIAITVAIPIAISVATATTVGLWVPLLVTSLSIGLLYYFAKDVINIAKEKLTSALSEACKRAIDFKCEGIKNASKGIIQTAEKIKNGLNNCKNDLSKQAANIEELRNQIEEFKEAIKEEKKNKEKKIEEYKDKINKQKEEIAEITKDLASTISSSLKNSAEVKEKTKSNISLVEEAKKEITLIQGACSEIAKDSQEIQKLSNGITNQIKDFNKKTVDKLKEFAEKNKIGISSEKTDGLEDEIFKRNLDKFYNRRKFSAEKSEGSNETIKKLIDKIFSSNVDPTEFAKLLTEIVNDQNKMNKAIMESSTKISELARKIHNEHVRKTQEFCIKIATALENIKTNEKTLLNMQAEYIEKLFSTAEKIIFKKFPKMKSLKGEEFLKEMEKHIEIGKKEKDLLLLFCLERKNKSIVNLEFEQLMAFSNILSKIVQISDTNNNKSKIGAHNDTREALNLINILGETSDILRKIDEINKKCTDNISTIQDNEIKNIGAMADQINESIKNIQVYSSKLTVKTINKSAHIATASAGAIIGGTAVGVVGTTVGLPVTLAVGTVGLLGTAVYKVIKHYKSNKN